MRIDWTESLSKRLVRRRFVEVKRYVSSILRLVVWCWGISLVACFLVRILLPDVAEFLPWSRILCIALLIPAFFLVFPFLAAILPGGVHVTEKGVLFQWGSGRTFFKYDQIVSISFVDCDGLRMFGVSFKTKKGNVVTWMAAASPKVRDEDVLKFLTDIGQVHLWKKEPGAEQRQGG